MAELADALDSGSSDSNVVEVQVLLPAPNKKTARVAVFFVFGLIMRVSGLSPLIVKFHF